MKSSLLSLLIRWYLLIFVHCLALISDTTDKRLQEGKHPSAGQRASWELTRGEVLVVHVPSDYVETEHDA